MARAKAERHPKPRYWEPDDPPAALFDWVSRNVEAATKEYWKGKITSWLAMKRGRFVVVVVGPDKPGGSGDAYTADIDLLGMVSEFVDLSVNDGDKTAVVRLSMSVSRVCGHGMARMFAVAQGAAGKEEQADDILADIRHEEELDEEEAER